MKHSSKSNDLTMSWFREVSAKISRSQTSVFGVAVSGSIHNAPNPSMNNFERMAFAARSLVDLGANGSLFSTLVFFLFFYFAISYLFCDVGVVVGGMGMGESDEYLQQSIEAVRQAVPANIPVVVQGMDTASQVVSHPHTPINA